MPYANDKRYKEKSIKLFELEKLNLLHVQNDLEVYTISSMRVDILGTGTKLFMPRHEVIETCVSK